MVLALAGLRRLGLESHVTEILPVELSLPAAGQGALAIETLRGSRAETATEPLGDKATGICVGAGTIAFFLLFQRGGPLSSVPVILAGGAAIMAIAGILFFREAASWQRLLGITLAIAGLFLLRR